MNDEFGNEAFVVPGGDILNYKPGSGIGCFTENCKFGFRATYDHKIGDQIFIDYGEQSNFDLLTTYGFVLEHNEFDFVNVEIPSFPNPRNINLYAASEYTLKTK